MAEKTIDRKYTMTRLEAGDYLLPSNDGATIWRLSRYEDGPTHGIAEMKRDRMFWGVWRWDGIGPRPTSVEDLEDWSLWRHEAAHLESRDEAINEAMRLGVV